MCFEHKNKKIIATRTGATSNGLVKKMDILKEGRGYLNLRSKLSLLNRAAIEMFLVLKVLI